jgi:holo-[acyl-carrier protein] synthase
VIVGHGIDVFELQQVERRLADPKGEWIDGVFTQTEQEQADDDPNRIQYYAGRYAAKEAVAKALGNGFSDNVAWLDVEIVRLSTGAPSVQLSGGALELAQSMGITRWFISITHTGSVAFASAIAIQE